MTAARKNRLDIADVEKKVNRADELLTAALDELNDVLRRASIKHRATADLEEARRRALVASHNLAQLSKAFGFAEKTRRTR